MSCTLTIAFLYENMTFVFVKRKQVSFTNVNIFSSTYLDSVACAYYFILSYRLSIRLSSSHKIYRKTGIPEALSRLVVRFFRLPVGLTNVLFE